jgi:hypothetical protein
LLPPLPRSRARRSVLATRPGFPVLSSSAARTGAEFFASSCPAPSGPRGARESPSRCVAAEGRVDESGRDGGGVDSLDSFDSGRSDSDTGAIPDSLFRRTPPLRCVLPRGGRLLLMLIAPHPGCECTFTSSRIVGGRSRLRKPNVSRCNFFLRPARPRSKPAYVDARSAPDPSMKVSRAAESAGSKQISCATGRP